uniref:DNA polymerase n=1 Tax=Lentinus flexipes TaxID=3163629 RepID=UPI002263C3E6|nr:DNA polymerase [Ganoderma flexipes]UYX56920.1 DNA polymerase [Ganoderma flexipes]
MFQDDSTFKRNVKANVAIAAAITSYARIHMNRIKQLPTVIYSDTDSAITTQPLPDHLVGKELGMFKDELNGCLIQEIYILGIKQYGFWYLDKQGNRIEKSVWAGYTRDSISFEEIKEIYNGKKIVKVVDNRFFRSLEGLTITIKPVKLTLQFKPQKVLINNEYLAPTVGLDNNDPILKRLDLIINKLKEDITG